DASATVTESCVATGNRGEPRVIRCISQLCFWRFEGGVADLRLDYCRRRHCISEREKPESRGRFCRSNQNGTSCLQRSMVAVEPKQFEKRMGNFRMGRSLGLEETDHSYSFSLRSFGRA